MKKFILIAITIILLIISGCNNKESYHQENTELETASEEIVATETNEALYIATKIYDISAKNAINEYCNKYLTFEGEPASNLNTIKECLTDSYYKTLISQNNNQKYNSNYTQATKAIELYYEEQYGQLHPSIIAICNQTILTDTESFTNRIVYKFTMIYNETKWLIENVEIIKE